MRSRCFLCVLALLTVGSYSNPKALANEIKWCSDRNVDADKRIDACTRLLNSGRLRQEQFASAYHNRGIAHAKKGLLDRAIADYSRVIEIKPDYAKNRPSGF